MKMRGQRTRAGAIIPRIAALGQVVIAAGHFAFRIISQKRPRQLKAEAMKCASLETMVQRAKESGMFNQEEADSWRGLRRREEEEVVEVVTEEGEVTVQRIVPVEPLPAAGGEILGPSA